MKTPPDDTTLALWLDDELEGEQLAQVEAWAAEHPDQLEAREQVRQWRKMISDSIPAAEEPPAVEFFNERILQHALRQSKPHADGESKASKSAKQPQSGSRRSWGAFWMPMAACAGMVLAFWLGALMQSTDSPIAGKVKTPNKLSPNLYTPEQGVEAEWISSNDASATVIVLNGVNAIPDEVDFSAVALRHSWREIDSTASSKSPTPTD